METKPLAVANMCGSTFYSEGWIKEPLPQGWVRVYACSHHHKTKEAAEACASDGLRRYRKDRP